MNLLKIAWKEVKHDFRDIRTLVFMIAFPIVLMLILGTALTGAFDGGDFDDNIALDDMTVLYENSNEPIQQPFDTFTKELEKSGIYFEQLPEGANGKEQVEEAKADAFLSIHEDGAQLYLNDQNSIGGSIIQGGLASFMDKFNLITEISKAAPEKLDTVLTASFDHDYIKDQTLLPDQQPGSMDYYAIVMTTMIALYAAISASHLITQERSRHTADRLMIAPIKKSEIFMGKLIGSIAINTVCIALVVAFSILFFHANWGEHLGLVALILLTEIIMAISFGLGLSFLFKTPTAPMPVIMIVLQLAAFFGGAYFPIGDADGLLKLMTNISPLTLENDAMFQMIYANDLSLVIPAIAMNLGISLLFLVFSTFALSRREGL